MYPKPYIDYLVHFHGLRDYFECHEILEEHWKAQSDCKPKDHWVGLIQVAVALYHQRRNNYNGAHRMMESALSIIENEPIAIDQLGIDSYRLRDILRKRVQDISNKQPYESLNLPINDDTLLSACELECQKVGCKYGLPSDLNNDFLMHKHKRRDRQEVINERLEQKKLRKKKREGQ